MNTLAQLDAAKLAEDPRPHGDRVATGDAVCDERGGDKEAAADTVRDTNAVGEVEGVPEGERVVGNVDGRGMEQSRVVMLAIVTAESAPRNTWISSMAPIQVSPEFQDPPFQPMCNALIVVFKLRSAEFTRVPFKNMLAVMPSKVADM